VGFQKGDHDVGNNASDRRIFLHDLERGSVIGVDTISHHYRIEYLGGDEIRISGHPLLCPNPVPAQLKGSLEPGGEMREGYVGCGARLVFRRPHDLRGVVTSTVTSIHQEPLEPPRPPA